MKKSLKIYLEYIILHMFRTRFFCWNYLRPNIELLFYLKPYHNIIYMIIAVNVMTLSIIKSLKICFKYIILHIFTSTSFYWYQVWSNLELQLYLTRYHNILYTVIAIDNHTGFDKMFKNRFCIYQSANLYNKIFLLK